jgi:signal transduction histidine kinase
MNNQQPKELNSQRTLDEVRKELEAAHEEILTLQSINEANTDFVSTVNHELRTPLTSIIGYIDLLQDFTLADKNNEFHRYLDVMDRNASILLDLVESILFLTALDSRDAMADTVVVDLVEICEKCVASQLLAIKTANINVSGNYDQEQTFSVLGDKTLLMQVFTNLISNAVKFSSENSKIDISFSRYKNPDQQKMVRVEVRDRGIGIPAQDLSLLFSRFFRASNARGSEIPGSGLGLAIVKRIVELHQGKIFAESTIGEGTSMIVELPFTVTALEELVMGKREDVLERAINSIANCQVAALGAVTHDVGGAIGFYTFMVESEGLLNFSRWLKANPNADQDEIIAKRDALLVILNQTLERIKRGVEF